MEKKKLKQGSFLKDKVTGKKDCGKLSSGHSVTFRVGLFSPVLLLIQQFSVLYNILHKIPFGL